MGALVQHANRLCQLRWICSRVLDNALWDHALLQ